MSDKPDYLITRIIFNNLSHADRQFAVNAVYQRVRRGATFLPRCMECRRGLAMRILYVCLSVCLSDRPSICPSHA